MEIQSRQIKQNINKPFTSNSVNNFSSQYYWVYKKNLTLQTVTVA